MAKTWKKTLAAVLALGLMTAQAPLTALAYDENSAAMLYQLGLFQGTGNLPDGTPNFALDRAATRGEGVTMLVRLLGAEADAKQYAGAYTFQDVPDWADPYVGYAYNNGITMGKSDAAFGTADPIDRNQFLTLLLRAMGYEDVDWRDPTPWADQIGLYYPAEGAFLRGDIADICLSALDCTVAEQEFTLIDYLAYIGAVGELKPLPEPQPVDPQPQQPDVQPQPQQPDVSQPFQPHLPPLERPQIQVTGPDSRAWVENPDQMLGFVLSQMEAAVPGIYIKTYPEQADACREAIDQNLDALPDATLWNYTTYSDGGLDIIPGYTDTARILASLKGYYVELTDQDQQLLQKANEIVSSIITSDMTEYDRALACHDYIVNTTSYVDWDLAHAAAGSLLYGQGVCDSYSMAYQLLCSLSGLECMRVAGYAGEDHAWNKVKVDGVWYNVDVTWDDPTGGEPVLEHNYFLISDSRLGQDHQWPMYSHIPESPADHPNYGY